MSESDRDALIDAYFEAMDAEDVGRVRPVLADGFVYESLSGDLDGAEGLATYIAELKSLSDTTHEITSRIHGADASVAEGVVTGEGADGPVEAGFCDVLGSARS
ncbi:MAG: nuclear transport factor 2 family protein [Haloarculaceae archaeon]